MFRIIWRFENFFGGYEFLGWGKGIGSVDWVYKFCKFMVLLLKFDISFNFFNWGVVISGL